MENLKKKLTSGADLEVTPSSFQDAHKLFKATMRELEKVRIELGAGVKASALLETELTDEVLNTIKNVVTRLAGSEEVEAALWPCMERALWKNRKCNALLFDDPQAREDFLEVAREVLLFNLRPFLRGLGSKFSGVLGLDTEARK